MKKHLSIGTLLLMATLSVFAKDYKISGKISDKDDRSCIEFANISISRADSTFLAGVNSSENGIFVLDKLTQGNYILSCSYLGYNTQYIPITLDADLILDNIELEKSSIALADVTVTANEVIKKTDRQIIIPNKTLMETSSDAMDLLKKLQLPRLSFNSIDNTLTTIGKGEVQTRINGVEVSIAEITALRPEDILRIEYHDDPGMRYGNAAIVIDYITRRRESGGNISTNLRNAFSKFGFAEDNFAANVNHKKSEFKMNAYWSSRNIDWKRENTDSYVFPDHMLYRTEIGEPTKFKTKTLNASFNYSLMEQDKYFLNIVLRNRYNDEPNNYNDRNSTIYSPDVKWPILVSDKTNSTTKIPSLDLYFQRNLKNDQLIIFNVVGTYIDSKNNRRYNEWQDKLQITDILSKIDGDKYSLITEGIYEKKLSNGKISGGIKHTQSYTNNDYSGNTTATVGMVNTETYAYIEYQLKKNKFNYTLSGGALRTYYSQDDKKNEKTIFRPLVRITYNTNDNLFVRYVGGIAGYAPSLSDLNDVTQEVNSLQIRKGNPNLKTVTYITNSLTAGFNKGIVGIDFYMQYRYEDKPIMDQTYYSDDKFVLTTENQRYFHRIMSEMTFKVKPLKDYLTLSVSPGVNRFISAGHDYMHTHTNWFVRAQLDANYKNWIFSAEFYNRRNWFWGETLYRGERFHILSAGYTTPRWSIMAGFMNPFEKTYKSSTQNYSKYTPSKSTISTDNIAASPFISVSYNFSFGRNYKSGDKRLNNSDTDSGMMSGSK